MVRACDAGASAGDLDHRREFAFGFGPVAADGLGAIAASTGCRVGAGEDAQLERADAALTNRSVHERFDRQQTAGVDGQMTGKMGKHHRGENAVSAPCGALTCVFLWSG